MPASVKDRMAAFKAASAQDAPKSPLKSPPPRKKIVARTSPGVASSPFLSPAAGKKVGKAPALFKKKKKTTTTTTTKTTPLRSPTKTLRSPTGTKKSTISGRSPTSKKTASPTTKKTTSVRSPFKTTTSPLVGRSPTKKSSPLRSPNKLSKSIRSPNKLPKSIRSPSSKTSTKTKTPSRSPGKLKKTALNLPFLSPAQKTTTPKGGKPPAMVSLTAPHNDDKAALHSDKRVTPVHEGERDWKYLYELSVMYDNYKLQEADEKKAQPKFEKTTSMKEQVQLQKPKDKKGIKGALEGLLGDSYNANGSFLNNEFVTKYLVENKKCHSLAFNFNGQPKLFKRFDKTDKSRKTIIAKFVDALINHPRSNEITTLNMTNSLIPDDFLEELSDRCINNPKALPKLQVLSLETNVLQGSGIVALARLIADGHACKYLQVLRLENQKQPMTSTAETALADAILQSESIVVCSLSVRGGLERQQINNTVVANLDTLRQARREESASNNAGKVPERTNRNEMEEYFDKIAANDSSIKAVDLVGNIRFLSLNANEKTKAGAAFANNTHVTSIKLVKVQLDEGFATALGRALETNTTITQLLLDSNAIAGEGMKALFEGLGKNSTVSEVQVRHQSKVTSSADEEAVAELVAPNTSIIKLGIDLRNTMAKLRLERQTNTNRETQRKLRAAQKKTT